MEDGHTVNGLIQEVTSLEIENERLKKSNDNLRFALESCEQKIRHQAIDACILVLTKQLEDLKNGKKVKNKGLIDKD
jgi:hypothetical protein